MPGGWPHPRRLTGAGGERYIERWSDFRERLYGLRVAWVSTASALIRLVLYFKAAQAQDLFLEVKGDPPAPIFDAVLLTFLVIGVLVVVHPLKVTGPFWPHRAVLLPIILGMPVALFTYITHWSARVRAPLIFVLVLVLVVAVVGLLGGDNYKIRTVQNAPLRVTLKDAIDQWKGRQLQERAEQRVLSGTGHHRGGRRCESVGVARRRRDRQSPRRTALLSAARAQRLRDRCIVRP
jgi:hypothetical protein